MREIANKERTLALIEHLGNEATGPGRVYLTGGSTAVLIGWRDTTMDVDLKLDPEPSGIFQAIARAKDKLNINIELASPDLFIPQLPGWRERSPHIASFGRVDFYHYDLYSQALAKLERATTRDLDDVNAMMNSNLIKKNRLFELFLEIEPNLIRHPNLNPAAFRSKIENFCTSSS